MTLATHLTEKLNSSEIYEIGDYYYSMRCYGTFLQYGMHGTTGMPVCPKKLSLLDKTSIPYRLNENGS
jgi:hypothetical protein